MKKIFNDVKKHLRSLLEIQGELLMRGNLTNWRCRFPLNFC